MSIKIIISAGLIMFITAAGYFWHSELLLSHQVECAARLNDFQKPIAMEYKELNDKRMQPRIGNAVEASNFVVAYSPKLHTCIGGFRDKSYDWNIDKTGVYDFTYVVKDLNTNITLVSYSTIEEMAMNLPNKPQSEETTVNLAGSYAELKYKAKLAELSGGQIKEY
jgi:hypothetical protein